MDPFLLASLLLLALLGATWLRLARRDRALARLRALAGAPAEGIEALEARVGSLAEATEAADGRAVRLTAELQSLVGAMPIGVLRVDDDLVVTLANPAAHEIAGRPAGTMVGRSLIEAFVEARLEEVAATARVVGSASAEVEARGSPPRSLAVRARRTPGGELWLMIQDVSELRRLERIRAEFIDNLSHELRTPITNVSLLTEALARQADVSGSGIDQQVRDRIARIGVETGHLTQMVEELLDLARIESGDATGLLDELDLRRLAFASVERMRAFAEQGGIELVVDAAAELPPVRGDEARIAQVLLNLLHNAIKFSPAGGRVTVRVSERGGEVMTSVADEGIGIRRADQARIFERFYKVDRARVRGGGTGLGLSIARHIVEAHGGRIGVSSREGHGSTFWFELPAIRREPGPPDATPGATRRVAAR